MVTPASRTAEHLSRVARWRRAGHPAAPQEEAGTEAALAGGADAPEALAAAGAHPAVIALVRSAANSADMDDFLETLAAVLGRAEERRRALQSAAGYPALLAATGVGLAVILLVAVRPAAGIVAGAPTGQYVPPPLLPSIAALLGTSAALAYFALALRADPPVFPFSTAKRRQERAVILGAAACAAANGAALHAALESAAGLSMSNALRTDAHALAAALKSGGKAPLSPLTGALGGALFAVAAARGEGPATLSALAEVAESSASADLPNQVLRAEVASMLVAAFAIALAGISIFQTYTGALGAP